MTDEVLRELYVVRGLTIRELCAEFGVSDEYLRKRLRQCGLGKRPGSFVPKLERDRAEVTADAAELYGAGLGLRDVGGALGISSSEVRELLHEAGCPCDRRAFRSPRANDTADCSRISTETAKSSASSNGSVCRCRIPRSGRGHLRSRFSWTCLYRRRWSESSTSRSV